MWTLKVILISIATISKASFLPSDTPRIANGFNAQKLTPKCFTTVHVEFPNSDVSRKCGGCLIAADKIITTGNCVTNAQDGNATNIKLTFGGGRPTNGVRGYGVSKISFAPGYDYLTRTSINNLAVLTLNKTVKFNTRLAAAVPYYNKTQDAFVDQQLLVCGYGSVDNHEKRPNSLQCTYLNGVAGSVCNAAFTTAAPASTTTAAATTTAAPTTTAAATTTVAGATTTTTVTTTVAPTTTTTAASTTTVTTTTAGPVGTGQIICTQNLDDSNACYGDQGSPVFVQMGTDWSLVGIVSTFPNARPNAACLDGHNTQILQLGAFSSWIPTA